MTLADSGFDVTQQNELFNRPFNRPHEQKKTLSLFPNGPNRSDHRLSLRLPGANFTGRMEPAARATLDWPIPTEFTTGRD